MPESLDGNQEQVRRVARQIIEAYKDERDHDEAAKKHPPFAASIPAWGGLFVSLGTIVFGAAFVLGDVDENSRRISAIESEQRTQANDNRQVIERMARIEAKLDIVLEGKE